MTDGTEETVDEMDEEALRDLAGALLDVGSVTDRSAEAAYQAARISENDFHLGWKLLMLAFDRATTPLQLQYVGAAVLELLFRSFPIQSSDAVVRQLQHASRFVTVVASASLSGVPEEAWRPVNEALRAAGVPESQLIDWSAIRPTTTDE